MSDTSSWVEETLGRLEEPLTLYAEQILRDVERARDVVQDAFLQLCRQRPEDLAGREREWLFRVCRNRAFDVLRKEKRMETSATTQAVPDRMTAPSPTDVLEEREGVSSMLDAVELLPKEQREVLRLKFQQGMSYREIAHVTELSVSNVGFQIHSAMKALRSMLGAGQTGAASTPGGVA